jgi:hypothetical protein
MANSFEPVENQSAARKALGVVIANVDADTVARLAVACRALRDDARCVPSIVFGPDSNAWTAGTDEPPDEIGAPGPADAVVSAVVTRHRPGRLRRLVLCPPPENGGRVFTAPWSRERGEIAEKSSTASEASKVGEKVRAVLPATLLFCCDASSALESAWAEPGATRLNENARTAGARGIIPVDKDDVTALVTRGVGACTLVPRAVGVAGLFTTNLTRLAVGGAAAVGDDDVRQFFRACASLRALEICEASDALTGKSWWSKEAPDAPAQVPKLERLRLARCGALREMTLFAPNLRDLAATDCPSFRTVAIDGGAGMEGELPAMRSAVFGDFRPVEAYHSENAARRATTPAETAVELVKRCVALETLSVPASATPEDKGDGDVLLSPEDRFVAAWTEALRDRAATLARVCVQRPLSVTNLARLVANVAGDTRLPRLAELYFAASTDVRRAPTEANEVSDALVRVIAMCPALEKVTIVDPGPASMNAETTQTSSELLARASLEIARGALLARCRVARSVAMDVTCDFHGEAAGTWLGTADARERDGLVAIQRALDADARGID